MSGTPLHCSTGPRGQHGKRPVAGAARRSGRETLDSAGAKENSYQVQWCSKFTTPRQRGPLQLAIETWFQAEFQADAYFPDFDLSRWTESSSVFYPVDEHNPYPFTFTIYER